MGEVEKRLDETLEAHLLYPGRRAAADAGVNDSGCRVNDRGSNISHTAATAWLLCTFHPGLVARSYRALQHLPCYEISLAFSKHHDTSHRTPKAK